MNAMGDGHRIRRTKLTNQSVHVSTRKHVRQWFPFRSCPVTMAVLSPEIEPHMSHRHDDRDSGPDCSGAPPTPPDLRVRIIFAGFLSVVCRLAAVALASFSLSVEIHLVY
jgi:hypothetical protein